jgi:hypothetical protein
VNFFDPSNAAGVRNPNCRILTPSAGRDWRRARLPGFDASVLRQLLYAVFCILSSFPEASKTGSWRQRFFAKKHGVKKHKLGKS